MWCSLTTTTTTTFDGCWKNISQPIKNVVNIRNRLGKPCEALHPLGTFKRASYFEASTPFDSCWKSSYRRWIQGFPSHFQKCTSLFTTSNIFSNSCQMEYWHRDKMSVLTHDLQHTTKTVKLNPAWDVLKIMFKKWNTIVMQIKH